MKASELRDLSIEELEIKEKELVEALFNLKSEVKLIVFQHVSFFVETIIPEEV